MVSTLKFNVTERNGVSRLGSLYVTPPFRVVSTAQLRDDNWEQLMIMSSSPGMLSSDIYNIDIVVERGAKVELESQSYQRIYNMDGEAIQRCSILLEDGAHFHYIPHPVVPHKGSKYISETTVTIGDDCSFLQGEIITCGRKHFGEMFLFDHLHTQTHIYHGQKLVMSDNILLLPKAMKIDSIGLTEHYSHQGSLLFYTTQDVDINSIIEGVYAIASHFKELEDMQFGISKSQSSGFVARALGNNGDILLSLFKKIKGELSLASKVGI